MSEQGHTPDAPCLEYLPSHFPFERGHFLPVVGKFLNNPYMDPMRYCWPHKDTNKKNIWAEGSGLNSWDLTE